MWLEVQILSPRHARPLYPRMVGQSPLGIPKGDFFLLSISPHLGYSQKIYFLSRLVEAFKMTLNSFLKLSPEYRDYVWGGDRLRPRHSPTAEAWVIWENDRIETGPLAGKSLAEAALEYSSDLLGEKAVARTGMRFPLLVKILDCAQWLSLQVHPNDEQVLQLEGPGQFGKTEAWHILEAESGAKLIAGVKPGTSPMELAEFDPQRDDH